MIYCSEPGRSAAAAVVARSQRMGLGERIGGFKWMGWGTAWGMLEDDSTVQSRAEQSPVVVIVSYD